MPERRDGPAAAHRRMQDRDSAAPSEPAPPPPAGMTGAERDPAMLVARMRQTPGLESLVAEAVQVWRARAGETTDATPGWRAFSDAFPTFWEFSNRPR